jgi:hypothetical protein
MGIDSWKLVVGASTPELSGWSSLQIVLLVFGLMFVMFAVAGLALWINVKIVRHDKRKVVSWLEARGCRIVKIELDLSLLRWGWRRASYFEVRFVDGAGVEHEAIVSVALFGMPRMEKDSILNKSAAK